MWYYVSCVILIVRVTATVFRVVRGEEGGREFFFHSEAPWCLIDQESRPTGRCVNGIAASVKSGKFCSTGEI